MTSTDNKQNHITVHALLTEVMPALNSTETLIKQTLHSLISSALEPGTRARRQEQLQMLELEFYRIRLNLEPLLRIHAGDIHDLQTQKDPALKEIPIDAMQAAAIRDVEILRERIQGMQAGFSKRSSKRS